MFLLHPSCSSILPMLYFHRPHRAAVLRKARAGGVESLLLCIIAMKSVHQRHRPLHHYLRRQQQCRHHCHRRRCDHREIENDIGTSRQNAPMASPTTSAKSVLLALNRFGHQASRFWRLQDRRRVSRLWTAPSNVYSRSSRNLAPIDLPLAFSASHSSFSFKECRRPPPV